MINIRLKEIREALNRSIDEFAQDVQIKTRTYRSYESGDRGLPTSLLEILQKNFNININWLVTGQGSMFIGNSKKLCRNPNVRKALVDQGERLESLQVENDLFISKMSEITKIKEDRLYELFKGKSPTYEEMLAFKENFDVSIDWLFFSEETPSGLIPARNDQEERISKLEEIVKSLLNK